MSFKVVHIYKARRFFNKICSLSLFNSTTYCRKKQIIFHMFSTTERPHKNEATIIYGYTRIRLRGRRHIFPFSHPRKTKQLSKKGIKDCFSFHCMNQRHLTSYQFHWLFWEIFQKPNTRTYFHCFGFKWNLKLLKNSFR